MARVKETIKNLGRAVRDQGKGRAMLTGRKTKRRPADTKAKKRVVRLRKGLPLKDGRTVKETKTKSGSTIGGMLARALLNRDFKKAVKKAKKPGGAKPLTDKERKALKRAAQRDRFHTGPRKSKVRKGRRKDPS